MKRIGNLMQKMLTEENFILAEKLLGKNKPDNRKARHIAKHAEEYGCKLLEKIKSGVFAWHEPKETTITESYKKKKRNLKIPCLEDQAAQVAWLNIAIPIIEKRNYYYNCGSIPNAGQTRAVNAVKKWLKDPRQKYGAISDIRKFYETCPHWVIRKGLYRIFKDCEFVEYAMGFTASMSKNGVGIAIGYPVSHWLANVALMELDHKMRRMFPDVHYVKYMDDIVLTSTNKRHIKKAILFIKTWIEDHGMRLKKYSWFKIKGRGITFLSYRFFNGYTLLTKPLMIRIARRIRNASKHMSAHVAAGVMSYLGILKHCDSYNFRVKYVYPHINKKTCAKLISKQSKNENRNHRQR